MLIAFLFDTVGRYLRYRSQLASIAELDDHILRDIGFTRSELRVVAWNRACLAKRPARRRASMLA